MAKKPEQAEHKSLLKVNKRGNKKAETDCKDRINNLLKLLFEKGEMTFKELCESLGVSQKTMSKYIKKLENENKIERIHSKGRQYRIKPESRTQVKFILDKIILLDQIWRLDYPDVLYFLQDFTLDLIMLRKKVEGSQVNLEDLVEQAKKTTFEILSKGKLS